MSVFNKFQILLGQMQNCATPRLKPIFYKMTRVWKSGRTIPLDSMTSLFQKAQSMLYIHVFKVEAGGWQLSPSVSLLQSLSMAAVAALARCTGLSTCQPSFSHKPQCTAHFGCQIYAVAKRISEK